MFSSIVENLEPSLMYYSSSQVASAERDTHTNNNAFQTSIYFKVSTKSACIDCADSKAKSFLIFEHSARTNQTSIDRILFIMLHQSPHFYFLDMLFSKKYTKCNGCQWDRVSRLLYEARFCKQ